MSALDFPNPVALPSELNYALPTSLPKASFREVRQPPNLQTYTTAGQVMQFDIPSGRSGDFADPTTTYLHYMVTFTSAGVNATDFSYLLGSAYSFFLKQEVYGNNSVLLEQINELGILGNMLLLNQLNDAERRGYSAALGTGFSATAYSASATVGHRIFFNATTENLTFEYAIPIIGILGHGTNKLIPVGEISGLRFELTLDALTNFTLGVTANKLATFTLSNIEFVANYINLDSSSLELIHSLNPQYLHIRTQTYKETTNFLPAGSGAGTYDLTASLRLSSVKSLYTTCYPSNAIEGKYASANPNLVQGTSWIIGGQSYPQRTLDPSNKPADCFMELKKSFGSMSYTTFIGCINKNGYYTSSTNNGLMFAYNTNVANVITNPNQFFLGIDTEVLPRKESLLSGINTASSSTMAFRAQVGGALSAYQHTFVFFAYYDMILEIDRNTKTIIAKF